MRKERVDLLLVERGLADNRSQAQCMIMAGKVRVEGQIVSKPATQVALDVQIEIEERPRFVSRGGEKLEAALKAFGIEVCGKVCVDVGASTGGFTDCLLQYGAKRVYAVDVGQGILHWKLRQDDRVVVLENTNARFLRRIPERPDIVTIDVSFISLKALLGVIRGWFEREKGQVIALIKPQFEVGKELADLGKGVIRDPRIHESVLRDVLAFAEIQAYQVGGLMRSPLKGPKGNVEFLAYLLYPRNDGSDLNHFIEEVILSASNENR
jgi:23S rRNA (cytidine1920-2'-O)/16S rRNA (cytidine1409-2'-O)-methyltransferase